MSAPATRTRLSAFGGIVALNRPIDLAAAEAIASTRIDAVIAPEVDEAARSVLARKTEHARRDCRLRGAQGGGPRRLGARRRSSSVRFLAAMLAQERDHVSEGRGAWGPASLPEGFRVATKRQPTTDEWQALRFAWRICAHVKSNTVIFTDARQTLAVGAGQMSRVDAVNVAVMKAREGASIAVGVGGRIGRVLSVPRRPRRCRRCGRDRRRAARRIRQGRRRHRRGRRPRPGDGLHGFPALPALKRWDQDTWPQRHKRSQRIIFQEQLSVSSVLSGDVRGQP